jgi:serine/threonine protein kinase
MSADPHIGHSIASYELVELLGEGGSGKAYLARNESGKQAVAKRLRDSLASEPDIVSNFLNVGELSSKVRMKKHVATVISQKRTGDGVFLLREFVVGKSLQEMTKEELAQLDPDRLARNICDGVRAFASRGVVHGGLHLGNIFVQENGDAKITDFATSRPCLENKVKSSISIDSLRYLSPEQWSGEPASSQSDIYAAGLIIAWIDLGKHVFDANDPKALGDQIRAGVTLECPILSAATGVRPSNRFPKIDELKSRLLDRAAAKKRKEATEQPEAKPAPKPAAKTEPLPSSPPAAPPSSPPAAKPAPVATPPSPSQAPPPKPAASTATVTLAITDIQGKNLLAKNPPPPWIIPRNGKRQQQPIRLSHDGKDKVELSVKCVGNGVTVSPSQLTIMPGMMGSMIVNCDDQSSQFVNLLFEVNSQTIVIKIVRTDG